MTKKSKTDIHADKPKIEELSNDDLDQVQGGSEELTLNYEEIKVSYSTTTTGGEKTIVGGFKSVSAEGSRKG